MMLSWSLKAPPLWRLGLPWLLKVTPLWQLGLPWSVKVPSLLRDSSFFEERKRTKLLSQAMPRSDAEDEEDPTHHP